MGLSTPLGASPKTETLPGRAGAPEAVCAFETNSMSGSVGLNSLPSGPKKPACVGNGDPGAGVSVPSGATTKLSIKELATRVPASFEPGPLNKMSPGCDPAGSDTVEPGIGLRCPPGFSLKPA